MPPHVRCLGKSDMGAMLAPMILVPMRLCDWGDWDECPRKTVAFGVGPDGAAKYVRLEGQREENVSENVSECWNAWPPTRFEDQSVEFCFEYMRDDGFLVVTDHRLARSVEGLGLTEPEEDRIMGASLYTRNGGYFSVVDPAEPWLARNGLSRLPEQPEEIREATRDLLRSAGLGDGCDDGAPPAFRWVVRYGLIDESPLVLQIANADASRHPGASKYLGTDGRLPAESRLKTNDVRKKAKRSKNTPEP